jgi:predicted aconitase
MQLTSADRTMLDGRQGPALALAMRVIVRLGQAMGADQLLDITKAHIDSCLHHGQAGLDFAEALVAGGGRVGVPTTLNVSSLDLLHPELFRGDPDFGADARRLMQCYEDLGCTPTWTCAPYQLVERPAFGEHIAWAESNAIVFANSVLGARTARYGDFVDICAALTGRAPASSFHLDRHRRGGSVFDVTSIGDRIAHGAGPALLGHVIGRRTGTAVPVVIGCPPLSEDQLKTLGSAAASSGSVAMFHVVGSTPEAPSLEAALGGALPDDAPMHVLSSSDLAAAWEELSTTASTDLGAVSLGTPHYSVNEFAILVELVRGKSFEVPFYVSTGRDIVTELSLRGWLPVLEASGVQLVTDTCTYITPVMAPFAGPAMTDSPKWAYYAPGNLGIDVVFGTVDDCVRSAVEGRVVRSGGAW